jgi:carbamoyl-phosphate synthase large subunit
MTTVLITAIGGDIAQSVATIVRDTFPSWRLLGTDLQARHGGALFVDELGLAPSAADAAYVDWLQRLIADEKVDICIPMSEAELSRLTQPGCFLPNVKMAMVNAKAIAIGNDKLDTANFLRSIGCPAPWTVAADSSALDVALPCIFKPRRGAGSRSVFICNTRAELDFYRERHPDGIFQELLLPADREVTCTVYRQRSGETVVLQLLRTLVGGFTGWAQVIDDAAIREQCVLLAQALELQGSINVQLRLTDDGPRIFEINARFSSTALMRHRMGFQDVVWTLRELLDEPVAFFNPPQGTTAVRIQGAALLRHPRQDDAT